MSWAKDTINTGPDELVRRNDPELLAALLIKACEMVLQHERQTIADRHAQSELSEIGARVLRLHVWNKRKTARIADLLAGTTWETL